DQLPALHALVLVADGQRDVLHVHVRRVAQERDLQHRGEEDHGKEAPVPAELLELLADDEADCPHHRSCLLRPSTLRADVARAKMTSARTCSLNAQKPTPFSMIARSAAR